MGHLFQGRFRAELVDEEGYSLEISRYIHLNPVRAGLVNRPDSWRWSSCPGYYRRRDQLAWVTYEGVLGEFARDETAARRAYRRFVNAAIGQACDAPWSDAVEGLIIGSKAFVDRIRGLLDNRTGDAAIPQLRQLVSRPVLARIIEAVAERFGCCGSGWSRGQRSDDAGRALAAYLARRIYGYSATAVAGELGYSSPSSVSHAVRRIERGSDQLRHQADQLAEELSR